MKRSAETRSVIVTLDEASFLKARLKAAERNMSLPRFMAELLLAELRRDDDYERAHRTWRAAGPFALNGPAQSYPEREDLHDRPLLRRH